MIVIVYLDFIQQLKEEEDSNNFNKHFLDHNKK